MASSKKSSTVAKSKEAGTSKPSAKTLTNTRKPANDDSKGKGKKKKVTNKNHAENGTAKDTDARVISVSGSGSGEDDADETTSKKSNTLKSKKTKRNHGKKEENGYSYEEGVDEKINKFPMHRVKMIMRDENADLRITHEALFAVNKATEMFLEQFCKDALACCVQDRKKSLAYKHLSSVVCKRKRYDFLSDFVPEKLKLEDALREGNTDDTEKVPKV